MNIMGTRGQIRCDMEKNTIEIWDFRTGDHTVLTIETSVAGHSGSDDAFMRGFLKTVASDGAFTLSSASQSVESHLIALAAEQSRVSGKTIRLDEFTAQFQH